LFAISALAVGEYYCSVEIKDPIKGIDVIVENCSNIGTLSIGGIYDGQWERLTYNYPMPWRGTFISVKVGDNIYSNSAQPKSKLSLDGYVVRHPWVEENAITTRWGLPENLMLEQRIEILENIAKIRIKVTNNNPNSLSTGVRLHLDTMLGHNDGAPIYIYGDGLQSYEKEYSESDMGFKYWEAYEREENPNIVSTGAIRDEDLTYTAPSNLILANWKTSMRSAWDYDADNSIPITRDSAVILYYLEEELLPGESKEVVFGYGRGANGTDSVVVIPTTVIPVSTTTIMVDRPPYPQDAGAINPFFLVLLLALILIVLAYIIYTKMPHGRVELKKLKEGELSKIVVWNKTNHVIRKCVLHDKLVKGAEVNVSTINVHRHGNSLTWNIGSLRPGEKAVLEYTIKGSNVLPKAKLSWDEGEVESS